ncbi:hypothetical protein LCGC14_1804700, partial [marine sediment metagenome]
IYESELEYYNCGQQQLIKVNKNTIRFKKLLRKFKRLQIASMPYNKFDLLDLD